MQSERTSTPTSRADQLRHCAAWLDKHEGSLTGSHDFHGAYPSGNYSGSGGPAIYLEFEAFRRLFAGQNVEARKDGCAWAYSLESDGILFKALEYIDERDRTKQVTL